MLNVCLNSLGHGGGRQVSCILAGWSAKWTKNPMVAVYRKKTVAVAVCYVVTGVEGHPADSWWIKVVRKEEQKNDRFLDFAWVDGRYCSWGWRAVWHLEKQSFRYPENWRFLYGGVCTIQVSAEFGVMDPLECGWNVGILVLFGSMFFSCTW